MLGGNSKLAIFCQIIIKLISIKSAKNTKTSETVFVKNECFIFPKVEGRIGHSKCVIIERG